MADGVPPVDVQDPGGDAVANAERGEGQHHHGAAAGAYFNLQEYGPASKRRASPRVTTTTSAAVALTATPCARVGLFAETATATPL